MNKLNLVEVADKIEQLFIDQENYVFTKYVTEFHKDGKFGGDHVAFIMIDPSTSPATFYEVTSPFDLVSGKAPQLALVFYNGECILNTDYTEYAAMRTGIMDAIILRKTRLETNGLRILMFGSGKTATWSIRGIGAVIPDIKSIDYWSKNGKKNLFEKEGAMAGISLNFEAGWREKLSEYDVIICHTNATEPVLKSDDLLRVKDGVEIHSFIGSTENGEIADEFYNSDSQLISDWPKILDDNRIMQRALKNGVDSKEIDYLKNLFSDGYKQDSSKKRLICQLGGTSIQNLAVLQLLTSAA